MTMIFTLHMVLMSVYPDSVCVFGGERAEMARGEREASDPQLQALSWWGSGSISRLPAAAAESAVDELHEKHVENSHTLHVETALFSPDPAQIRLAFTPHVAGSVFMCWKSF